MTDISHVLGTTGVKAVIFDCDGVLIDSWASTMYYFNHVRSAVGLEPMGPDLEEYCFIHTVDESIAHIVPGELLDAAMAVKTPMPFEAMLPLITPQSGVARFLDLLAGAGLRLAVDTNGGHEQHMVLKSVELHQRFDMVVTADDVERGKPWPDGPMSILDRFGLRPDQALFIGDSIMDQRAAHSAGIPFWAFGNPALDARRHIAAYAELF